MNLIHKIEVTDVKLTQTDLFLSHIRSLIMKIKLFFDAIYTKNNELIL